MGVLDFICTKPTQMRKLCEVANASDKVTIDSHYEHGSGIPSFVLLNHYLDLRLNEFHHFTNYKVQMMYLLTYLKSIEVTG